MPEEGELVGKRRLTACLCLRWYPECLFSYNKQLFAVKATDENVVSTYGMGFVLAAPYLITFVVFFLLESANLYQVNQLRSGSAKAKSKCIPHQHYKLILNYFVF